MAVRNLAIGKTLGALTPGSVTEACMNDEIQMKKRYAKKTGTAGDV